MRPLLFKYSIFDSQTLNQDKPTRFFEEQYESEFEEIRSLSEEQVVKHILSDRPTRYFFLSEFSSTPNSLTCYSEIKSPITTQNSKPGDIDILIHPNGKPNESIAFEVKKVKALLDKNGDIKFNGLDKLKSGVIQANAYLKLGFHKCYLLIVVEEDGRQKLSHPIGQRSGTLLGRKLTSIIWLENLDQSIGICYLLINQPTNRDFKLTGKLGIAIDRPAVARQQESDLSQKIDNLKFHP